MIFNVIREKRYFITYIQFNTKATAIGPEISSHVGRLACFADSGPPPASHLLAFTNS